MKLLQILKRMLSIGLDIQPEDNLVSRVLRYRGIGSDADGIHLLRAPVIDDLDYELMGADNSCAKIARGEDATTGQWFAIKKGSQLSKKQHWNSHGTSDDGGKTFYTEDAYLSVPKPSCRVSPEEVVWHHLRVKELRAQNVPQPDRVRIMTAERQAKPWDEANSGRTVRA